MELFEIGFLSVTLKDIIDVGIVTFIFYKLYDMLKGSLSIRLLGVVFTIFLLWKVVALMELRLLKSIMDAFLDLGAVALVIIFAPEIRKFLSAISKNTLLDRILRPSPPANDSEGLCKEVAEALKDLRATGNGALIVVLGKDMLEDIQQTGDQLDANVSSRLIFTIFQKESPLHDGAMILQGNRILAVRCILPISQRTDIAPELGMRHRAAIGVAEISDALVIIASEERRELSVVERGKMQRNISHQEIEEALQRHEKQLEG